KDKVLRKGFSSAYGERASSIANEASSLLDGDVKKFIINGLLAIDFSDRDGCPHIQAIENNSREIAPVIKNPRTDVNLVIGNSDFGPWMLVERRFRHNLCEQRKHGKTGKGDKLSWSRFHALSLNSNFLGKGERYSTMEINGKILLMKILESYHQGEMNLKLEIGKAFEEVEVVAMTINEGFLDSNNHSVVTFQATSSSILTGVKGVNRAANLGNTFKSVNNHDNGRKTRDPTSGWKTNKTLKGPSNCFKAMGNSWVSLAGFMKMATNFISWKLDNQAAKEQLTEETEGLDSSVHAHQ
ncbi:hypothetical protein Gogos_004871, partial [Gossypium gossypioides]|nr:hypothetical protein [Gossypium gossypioides]